MTIDRDRSIAGASPDRSQLGVEIVMDDSPRIDERASAAGGTEAALVVGRDVEPRGGQAGPDMLVSPGVLGDPVNEQDERPRFGFGGRRPAADEELLVSVRSCMLGR
jgi:hypothetical protein